MKCSLSLKPCSQIKTHLYPREDREITVYVRACVYVGVFMMLGGGPCWFLGYTHPSVSAGSCFQCGAFLPALCNRAQLFKTPALPMCKVSQISHQQS